MKNNKKLHQAALALAVILFLILVTSTASADPVQDSTSWPYAYITNYAAGTVSVIDINTNTVADTVPVGNTPFGVVINPEATKVYVTNWGSNNVSVIDTATNTVIATVPVGSEPKGIAINPEGTKVYVANTNSRTVSVIDTATDTVTTTVNVGSYPLGVAFNPVGSKAYVTNYGTNTVSVINTATDTVTATVPVGSVPSGIIVNTAGTKVYVANSGSNTLSVINTTTNTVTATVKVGRSPFGVAINRAGAKLYVTNAIQNTVSVIDTATDTVTATVYVGINPSGIAVNPVRSKVYVANHGSNTISVINTITNAVAGTVSVGAGPTAFGQSILSPPVPVGANLSISTQAPTGIVAGSSMTYTLHYLNSGNKDAHNVVIEDILSDDVEFEFASSDGVYNSTTRTVTWDLGLVTPERHGYRTVNVRIPKSVPVETVIQNNAFINTSDLETEYKDNEAHAQTRVIRLLPENVGVEPNYGGQSILSINWNNPITFSYHSCDSATAVDIRIHTDAGSDIVGSMTGGPSDWTYTVSPLYPRHGQATITYTVHGCNESSIPFPIYIDPAGYIYDVNTGERISNASVWLQTTDGMGSWENVPTGEDVPIAQPDVNPQVTDVDGMYQWDVLNGSYKVHVEASGYEPADSIVVSIPPPVTDLNVGLTHIPVFPVANFTSNVTSGNVPLSVQFTDLSENVTEWNWDFGDETNSTDQNPMHTFSTAGLYTVNLTVSNSHGTDSKLATITVSEKSVPILPVANFTSNVTSGNVPLSVQFTDLSENATEWNWDFGDETNSMDQNPMHTFSTAGEYTVNLTVSNSHGTDSKLATITVSEKSVPILPVANFSANPTSGKAPLNVKFNDTSTGSPTSWFWKFGDGSKSYLQNPTHKYSKAGTYTVNLTVKNAAGRDMTIKTGYIKVITKPVANFTSSVTSGKVPLKVTFTDTSTGTPIAWKWDFGDGSKSYHQNPTHKYSKAGIYTVNLTVKNAVGRNTVTKTEYIKVVTKPVANFTSSVTSGKVPLNVAFTDTSTGSPTSWKWDFGDGSKSYLQNPTHKYSKAGVYTVNLTVKNAVGRNTVTKTDYIKVVTKPVANFSANPTSGKTPLKVTFTDTSTGTPSGWKWDFGDGSKSYHQNPTHKYSNVGTYTVNLTVKNAVGRNTVTKIKYIKVIT